VSWCESKGKKLEGRAVTVEARKVADRVIAIVQQPVEPVLPKGRHPSQELRSCLNSLNS